MNPESHSEKNQAVRSRAGESDVKMCKFAEGILQVIACRICLEDIYVERISDSALITPCSCSGTLKYVHEKCINTWIDTKVEDDEEGDIEDFINCELCRTQIYFEAKTKITCNKTSEIKESAK